MIKIIFYFLELLTKSKILYQRQSEKLFISEDKKGYKKLIVIRTDKFTS